MILEIFAVVFFILSFTLAWTSYNQIQKVERLEEWIENFSAQIILTQRTLDELDSEGKFKSDDDIGTVFTAIKDTVNGTFSGGPVAEDVESGGIDISYTGGYIDDIKDEIEAYRAKIISGEIVVPSSR